jgi:electron transfer flavoprotein alpha subunit
VIAVPDLDRGRLTALDRDLIGAARVLADAQRGAVLVVVPSDCAEDLGIAGADRVVRYAVPAAGSYLPVVLARALAGLAQRHEAPHLLFADALTGGGDVGRRVAARLGVRPAAHVALLTAGEVVCRSDCGRCEILRAPPRVLLVEAGCAEPVAGARHQARPLPDLDLGSEPGAIDLGMVKVDRNAVPLIEAELIISAGAGVSDWAAFHRLAAELGAVEGASRVVCDLGHLPRDRQIGASGTVVEPRAYLAFGISGAPQHLQGIARCERVVAVNSDPHAPMMQRADLAIVADAQQVMPALTELIERERRGA